MIELLTFFNSEGNLMERPGRVCLGPYKCYAKYLSFFSYEKVNQYLGKRLLKKFFGMWLDKKKIVEAKKIIK
jgi:hypothetical protein